MLNAINPLYIGSSGGGLVPTIRAYAPVGSSVTCDGQTKVVGADGFVDFVVSAEPRNILPDDVQGLEYIESNWPASTANAPHICTGITSGSNIGVEMRFIVNAFRNGDYNALFGSTIAGNVAGDFYVSQRSSTLLYVHCGSAIQQNITAAYNTFHDVVFNVEHITSIDGTTISTAVPTISGREIGLFCWNSSAYGFSGGATKSQICYAKIYDRADIVRDYIPCIYNSQVGMWDMVTNAFFGNQGTGSFIAGEPKEWLDFPIYTVTVGGASQMVKVDRIGLYPIGFN